MEEFLREFTKDISHYLDRIHHKFHVIGRMLDRYVNGYVVLGIVFWVLAIVFHEKKKGKLKIICFGLGMMFFSIAAIGEWVDIEKVFFLPRIF